MRLTIAEITIVAKRGTSGPYSRNSPSLGQSIHGTLRSTSNGYIARVGSNKKYAASVEQGARRHFITPRNPSGYLHFYWVKRQTWVRTRLVNHPGQRGKGYLRHALRRVARRRGFTVIINDD